MGKSLTVRSHNAVLAPVAVGLLVLAACGGDLRGDPGAEAVSVVVHLDRAWVRHHSDDVILIGDGPTAADGKEAAFGFGHGTWRGTTEVTLHGGTRPRGRELFTKALSWGTTRFSVPLRRGREVFATVTIGGERSGMVSLPPQAVTDEALVLDLRADAIVPDPLPADGESQPEDAAVEPGAD